MKNKIETIFDDGYQVTQYYNESWKCGLVDQNGNDVDVPLTLVVEVLNMDECTGEEEYKDYPCVFSIGILNKDIHRSIQDDIQGGDDFDVNPNDVIGYYGMNCYLEQQLLNTDMINKKLLEALTIFEAATYTNRFNGEEETFLKFKTEEQAFNFAEKLINEYGNMVMSLVGFYLDQPVNLMGETGWRNTNRLHFGEV